MAQLQLLSLSSLDIFFTSCAWLPCMVVHGLAWEADAGCVCSCILFRSSNRSLHQGPVRRLAGHTSAAGCLCRLCDRLSVTAGVAMRHCLKAPCESTLVFTSHP